MSWPACSITRRTFTALSQSSASSRLASGLRFTFAPTGSAVTGSNVTKLSKFISDAQGELVCLTGAGCSTESGVPDYRGPQGSYSKGHVPMTHAEFCKDRAKRARYWARSLPGYKVFAAAKPNLAHRSVAALERHGFVSGVITQNVDGLHQQAGTGHVIDLHGRNDQVGCLSCGYSRPRMDYQDELEEVNREWVDKHLDMNAAADVRADGDAHLSTSDFADFIVPPCSRCGGILKPRLVFFGGALEPSTRDAASQLVESANALLVIGSSVQVFSAFSLVRACAKDKKPVMILNVGETRADDIVPSEYRLPLQAGAALSSACLELGINVH